MIHIRAFQSLVFIFFPTQRNVPELTNTETIIHILLILVLNKGRESDELFNIRPSVGCAEVFLVAEQVQPGLREKVRGPLESTRPGVYLSPEDR